MMKYLKIEYIKNLHSFYLNNSKTLIYNPIEINYYSIPQENHKLYFDIVFSKNNYEFKLLNVDISIYQPNIHERHKRSAIKRRLKSLIRSSLEKEYQSYTKDIDFDILDEQIISKVNDNNKINTFYLFKVKINHIHIYPKKE